MGAEGCGLFLSRRIVSHRNHVRFGVYRTDDFGVTAVSDHVYSFINASPNRIFSHSGASEIWPYQYDRDVLGLWTKPHIGFTPSEERRGFKLLEKLGMPPDAKWVCLMVRDQEYLRDMGDYRYHDYRDSDVDSYAMAVEALLERGFWVIRMGVKVEKPMKLKHPRLIDYAWEGKRTEFGDLYLGAKCEFCLGVATGFIMIPQVFGRPVVMVNFAPLEYAPTFYDKALVIWKHHVKDGKRMTLPEIFTSGAGQFTDGGDYGKQGITLEDNTPREIYEATMEMADNYQNAPWKPLQDEFWNHLPISVSPFNLRPINGARKMRVGEAFMKEYT